MRMEQQTNSSSADMTDADKRGHRVSIEIGAALPRSVQRQRASISATQLSKHSMRSPGKNTIRASVAFSGAALLAIHGFAQTAPFVPPRNAHCVAYCARAEL